MGLFDFYRKKPKKQQVQTYATLPPMDNVTDFGGTRTTIPKFTMGGGGVGGALTKRAQSDLKITEASLNSATIEDMIDILADAHPDVSYAIWNFLRLGNSDYKITVRKPGSDKPFTQGEKFLTEFFDTLEVPNLTQYGTGRGIKKVLNQLLLSTVTRGAASLELVLTGDKTGVGFIAPVDPGTIEFKFESDRYVPYQNDGKLSLDIPTFLYEGLDEKIDDPYGRSPLLGAINMVLFQLQILADIKAVVHNQGYPRFDIKIVEEVLLQRMPIGIRNNEVEKQKWLNNKLNEIIDMYNGLDPDDTFVHFDSIEIGMAGGAKGGGALIDPQKLMAAIDNLVMTGLKTLSTILGRRTNGNTESFAKIEIKLYTKGVEAIQGVVERLMSRALTLLLNLNGKQGIVKFEFEPIEIRTELEQAQFEQIKLLNIMLKRDNGWIDNDQASMLAVGTPAVAEPNYEALGKGMGTKNKDGGTPGGSTDNNPSAGGSNDASS
jgi:hypothetical protein